MSFQIKDKVAIVTGGSSGIGLATVKMLLSEGARVAWCGRNQERLDNSYKKMASEFDEKNMFTDTCDVLSREEVNAFIKKVADHFGGIDMLISNAGQSLVKPFDEIEEEDWINEVKLKYFGLLYPTEAARPYLKKSSVGSIAVSNSLLGYKPEENMAVTSAARAGLLNLVKSLSMELLEDGIRINSILLGLVESGQWERRFEKREDKSVGWEEWTAQLAKDRDIAMKRLGKPEEAANALVFLASPLSSYTTGSCIDVSGGSSRQI